MKYDIISDSASLITGAYALVNIQEILSIVILVLSIETNLLSIHSLEVFNFLAIDLASLSHL